MAVRPESQHDQIEPAGGRNGALVVAAHLGEIDGVHRERPAAPGGDGGPAKELRAHLPPEVAVGRRRRTQLVDREHAHARVVDRLGRLQGLEPPVHAPRRPPGRHRQGEVGPRTKAITEEVGGHLRQLIGIARDDEAHRTVSVY